MRNKFFITLVIVLLAVGLGAVMFMMFGRGETQSTEPVGEGVKLPAPRSEGELSLEEAILGRRSVREYTGDPLALAEVSQLLWAAQGITHPGGYRTAPSAGALYPLEIYLLAGDVNELPSGIYKYSPINHELVGISEGDKRGDLYEAALSQGAVKDAAAVIVIAAVYDRTTVKYGDRGIQYVHMEVGSVAQNVYLQAVSLNLGTVFIGAFHDDAVKVTMNMTDEEQPLGIMPVGRK